MFQQNKKNLFKQLKSGLNGEAIWNKYNSRSKVQDQDPYFDYMLGPSF